MMLTGACLLLIGSGAFIASSEPPTLIPMAFGIVMLILSLGVRNPRWAFPLQLMAAGLAFMGMLSTASSLPLFLTVLGGGSVDNPGSVVATGLLGVLCVVYVTLSVRWYLANRQSSSD
jgi:hypothetical protein